MSDQGSNSIRCPHCGSLMPAGTRFCRKCGRMLDDGSGETMMARPPEAGAQKPVDREPVSEEISISHRASPERARAALVGPTDRNEGNQLPIGTILKERYYVGGSIGAGGFGITYAGWDLLLDSKVAIKEYYPAGMVNRHDTHSVRITVTSKENSQQFRKGMERFLEEARVMARFSDDPCVCSVKNFFEANDTAYIVMEFLDGQSLREYASGKAIPFDVVYTMLSPVMDAFDRIHRQGFIHRDISPSNLMILRNGKVKILDFGTARDYSQLAPANQTIMLKQGYAPEEQYRGQNDQGPWTDVYALCASIYRLVTGRTPDASVNRMYRDDLVPPSALGAVITPAQEAVLLHGMAVRHEERIRTMMELRAAFEAAGTGMRQMGPPPGQGAGGRNINAGGNRNTGPAAGGGRKSSKLPWIIGIVAALAVVVAGIILIMKLNQDDTSVSSKDDVTVEREARSGSDKDDDSDTEDDEKETKKKAETEQTSDGSGGNQDQTDREPTDETKPPETAPVRETEPPPETRPEPETEKPAAPVQDVRDDRYICPGSDCRYLTEQDLADLSDWELLLARNEIFARHGRKFVDQNIQAYFNNRTWYNGTIEPDRFNSNVFNSFELWNIDFIKEHEEARAVGDYICPYSCSRYLTAQDVANLTSRELTLARNEIYARHGRKFNDPDIQAYFNGKSWYRGTIEPSDFDTGVFNEFERYNIDFIASYES